MAHPMRIDVLKSVAEAAGLAMAPGSDQFEGEPDAPIVDIAAPSLPVSMDAGNYSRSWARPLFRDTFPEETPRLRAMADWLKGRRSRVVAT
jgi:hypothetical protein